MRKHIVLTAFLVSALSTTLAVAAGEKRSEPVTIDTVARKAAGSLGSTRNSSSATSYIGCQVLGGTTFSPQFVCSARVGSSNTFAACSGTNAGMVQAAAATGPDSKINFAWDASGVCTSLTVTNYSFNEPKAP